MENHGHITFANWDKSEKALIKLGDALEEYEAAVRNDIIEGIKGIPGERGTLLNQCLEIMSEQADAIMNVHRDIYDPDISHANYPFSPGYLGGDFTYQMGGFINNASALEEMIALKINERKEEYTDTHNYGKVRNKQQIGYKNVDKQESKRRKEFLNGGRERRAEIKAIVDTAFSSVEIVGLVVLAASGVGTPIVLTCCVSIAGEAISTAGSITDVIESQKAYDAKINGEYVKAKIYEKTDNVQNLLIREYGKTGVIKNTVKVMNNIEFAGGIANLGLTLVNPGSWACTESKFQKFMLGEKGFVDIVDGANRIVTSGLDIYDEFIGYKYGQSFEHWRFFSNVGNVVGGCAHELDLLKDIDWLNKDTGLLDKFIFARHSHLGFYRYEIMRYLYSVTTIVGSKPSFFRISRSLRRVFLRFQLFPRRSIFMHLAMRRISCVDNVLSFSVFTADSIL